MHSRLNQFFRDLNSKYRNNMSVRQKNLHHIKFLLSSYYKHEHELGYMFHAYLNIVCTAMERINNLSRPAFMFSGASVTAGMVDQYQDQTFIKKIRLCRVQSGNLTGRAIMKEVVFRVSRTGNPLRRMRRIRLAGDALQLGEPFLIPPNI
ncbi:4-alpha-glucan branching enzyme GlgB [Striga asiatica]|uniref:4-alpha-glucan branching enzyme GlgB n=1 Tax=Striga asiatica TaxID=4170 RepID=A0A5A7P934_STRAF|nr:4-alpha-glucan branching enzyme GlgB [Striga asiatica]